MFQSYCRGYKGRSRGRTGVSVALHRVLWACHDVSGSIKGVPGSSQLCSKSVQGVSGAYQGRSRVPHEDLWGFLTVS